MRKLFVAFLIALIFIQPVSAVNFSRYGSMGDWESAADQKNGSLISKYLDLYTVGSWLNEAITGIHSNGKKIAVYINLQAISINSSLYTTAKWENWLLKDASGQYIYEIGFPENVLVDPKNAGYQAFLKTEFDEFMWAGFDAVFADNSFHPAHPSSWDISGKPINRETSNPYTDSEWREAWVNLLHYLRLNCPKVQIISNGIFNGDDFYTNKANIIMFLKETDIVPFSEGVFTNLGKPYNIVDWEKSLQWAKWMNDNYLNDTSKKMVLYSLSDSDSTSRLIWGSSALAITRFNQVYLSIHERMNEPVTQQLFNLNLGFPRGEYYKINGTSLYRRDFTNYIITVNPTDNDIIHNGVNYPAIDVVVTTTSTILVDRSAVSKSRCDVGSQQFVSFHSSWGNDGKDVVNGTIFVKEMPYITNSTGWIKIPVISNNVGSMQWSVTGVYFAGFTGYLQTTQNPSIVWDEVVLSLENDQRIDAARESIKWTGKYAYDDAIYQGAIFLNDTLPKNVVGSFGFKVGNISDHRYGLSKFSSNEVRVIFDRVKVTEWGVSSKSLVVNQQATIWFKAYYEYDNTTFLNDRGSLKVNGEFIDWSPINQRWEKQVSSVSAQKIYFKVDEMLDIKYGLTTLNDNIGGISVEWVNKGILYLPFESIFLGILLAISIFLIRTRNLSSPISNKMVHYTKDHS